MKRAALLPQGGPFDRFALLGGDFQQFHFKHQR